MNGGRKQTINVRSSEYFNLQLSANICLIIRRKYLNIQVVSAMSVLNIKYKRLVHVQSQITYLVSYNKTN